jgi:hypothetical protein
MCVWVVDFASIFTIFTYKTDLHDITEVALNIITLTQINFSLSSSKNICGNAYHTVLVLKICTFQYVYPEILMKNLYIFKIERNNSIHSSVAVVNYLLVPPIILYWDRACQKIANVIQFQEHLWKCIPYSASIKNMYISICVSRNTNEKLKFINS